METLEELLREQRRRVEMAVGRAAPASALLAAEGVPPRRVRELTGEELWAALGAHDAGEHEPSAYRRPELVVVHDEKGRPGLSPADAARLLGVSRYTVYDRHKRGLIAMAPSGVTPGRQVVLLDEAGRVLRQDL